MKNGRHDGFTLVEMLIVVVVLGILAGVVIVASGYMTRNVHDTSCDAQRRELESVIQGYTAANQVDSGTVGLAELRAGTQPLLKADPADFTVAGGVVTATGACTGH